MPPPTVPTPSAASRHAVLSLYRTVVRTARAFPDRSVAKKLLFNARELIRLRRDEHATTTIDAAVADGYAALRVYTLLQREPHLLTAITRKSAPVVVSSHKADPITPL